jgi:hypothetical protein
MVPNISIGCVANLFSKQLHFVNKNDLEVGHTHPFDHLTLLAHGSLEVTVNGKTNIYKAPHMIYISKDHKHELKALEDNTVAYCIHALRNGNGVDDILDPNMVPDGIKPIVNIG